jgi:hypothetical protein
MHTAKAYGVRVNIEEERISCSLGVALYTLGVQVGV